MSEPVTGVECVDSCPVETCTEGPLRACSVCGVTICDQHGGGQGRYMPRCTSCSAAFARLRTGDKEGEADG